MKRGYMVTIPDGEYGIAVVAHSAREAKKMSWGHDSFTDCEWTELTVRWQKKSKVEDLDYGVLGDDDEDLINGLKAGIYTWIEMDCPKCNGEGHISLVNGEPMCSNCEDELEENK